MKETTIKSVNVKGATTASKIVGPKVPHFFKGNTKVGTKVLLFNKLAGNTVFNGCVGSCGQFCEGCWNSKEWRKSPCYVAKSYIQYGDNTINAHILNTIRMREDVKGTFEELNEQLKRKRTAYPVRIHGSGELESPEELKGWAWLASQHPERPFYIYTKAFPFVDELLTDTSESSLPKNFFINVSVWHEFGITTFKKWEYIPTIRAFAYDDGFNYLQHGLEVRQYCPAYKKNKGGKIKMDHNLTCEKCGLCFSTKARILGCLDH